MKASRSANTLSLGIMGRTSSTRRRALIKSLRGTPWAKVTPGRITAFDSTPSSHSSVCWRAVWGWDATKHGIPRHDVRALVREHDKLRPSTQWPITCITGFGSDVKGDNLFSAVMPECTAVGPACFTLDKIGSFQNLDHSS